MIPEFPSEATTPRAAANSMSTMNSMIRIVVLTER